MKLTILCMTVGALALSGIWPLSGYYSKEEILAVLTVLRNPMWLGAGLLGVFLTAYYTFRLMFVILFPAKIDAGGHGGEHGSNFANGAMYAVLVILAVITMVIGIEAEWFRHFLDPTAVHATDNYAVYLVQTLSPALAIVGIILAWWEFGRTRSDRIGFAERNGALHRLFAERWYLDRLYGWMVNRLLDRGIAEGCRQNETRVIEGVIHAVCNGVIGSSRAAAGWHLVMIQSKLMVVFAVVFGLTLILLILGH